MNELIKFYLNAIKSHSLSLNKMVILVNKPWVLVDHTGALQKLIFRKNGELILSVNGKVHIGKWEYLPALESILLERVDDKVLLNEVFVDENALILKKDGTDQEFFPLVNEQKIPNYDIVQYLLELRNEAENISRIHLQDGKFMEVRGIENLSDCNEYEGKKAEVFDYSDRKSSIANGFFFSLDNDFEFHLKNGTITRANKLLLIKLRGGNLLEIQGDCLSKSVEYEGKKAKVFDSIERENSITNGYFFSANDDFKFHLKDGVILKRSKVFKLYTNESSPLEIEDGGMDWFFNLGKKVTMDGKPVSQPYINLEGEFYYRIKGSKIVRLLEDKKIHIKGVGNAIIRKDYNGRIKAGDEIISIKGKTAVLNGKYKLVGSFRSLKFENNFVI